MFVPMMNIGIMRVGVGHRLVNVAMTMRLRQVGSGRVFVLVVFIVNVAVRMFQPLVRVFVFMFLGQVQPDASAHEGRRYKKQRADWFMQQDKRNQCADKRGYCKIR